MGKVNFLLESYMNGGRMKTLRSSGSWEDIVVSASRLVVMYLLGSIGAPPEAEMNTKVDACSFKDSCAKAIAVQLQAGC